MLALMMLPALGEPFDSLPMLACGNVDRQIDAAVRVDSAILPRTE